MDFSLTEEQEMFRRMMRDFATKELEPVAARYDEAEEFPAESIPKMAALGLMGLTIPEEYGGSGGDSVQMAIAMEEVARACAATSVILGVTLGLCNSTIYRAGDEEQRKRFVVPLAKGKKLGAFGLTEATSGSDAASLQTTATRRHNRYVLNGTKQFISNGAEADIVVVFTTIDRSLGAKGITAFVVEKGMPGFSVGKHERKLGIRASSTTELIFEDCTVPEANRLGEEGKGFGICLQTLDHSRIGIAAQAVGIAQAALEASLDYARQRMQFGKPIASFEAIQFMLADMATSIEAARLLTYRAAYLADKALPFAKEASMSKVFAAETAMKVTTEAIQIHGGYGYVKDYPVERYFRDAKVTEIYEGTSQVQRLVIARNIIGRAFVKGG